MFTVAVGNSFLVRDAGSYQDDALNTRAQGVQEIYRSVEPGSRAGAVTTAPANDRSGQREEGRKETRT